MSGIGLISPNIAGNATLMSSVTSLLGYIFCQNKCFCGYQVCRYTCWHSLTCYCRHTCWYRLKCHCGSQINVKLLFNTCRLRKWKCQYVVTEKTVMEKKIKWRCRGSNPGPFTCKANAVPLGYIGILEDRAFKTHLFTVGHYFVVMIRAEWSEYL